MKRTILNCLAALIIFGGLGAQASFAQVTRAAKATTGISPLGSCCAANGACCEQCTHCAADGDSCTCI
jgi:hypothetical protein